MAYYAYTLLENGKKNEAFKIFELIIDFRTKTFNVDTLSKYQGLSFTSIVDLLELAQVYSAMGDTENAMKLFDFWIEKDLEGWINIWRDCPLMGNIQNQPKIIEYCNKSQIRDKIFDKKVKRILAREGFIES